VININLSEKPEWYFEINPMGLVPSITWGDDFTAFDSVNVAEFLNSAFPGPNLAPRSPSERAHDATLLALFSNKVLQLISRDMT